jgi:uncharacterized protein YjdB
MMRALPFVAVVLSLTACERVDYIDLKPSTVVIKQPANLVYVEAIPMSRQGARATKVQVAWSIKDPEIASVDKKGGVKGLKSGHTEVIAKVGDVEAHAQVDVLFVEKLEVEPKTIEMTEGDPAAALKITAYDLDGKVLKDRTPTLNTSDSKVARATGGGTIMALDPGKATITVQVEGKSASVDVTVKVDPKAEAERNKVQSGTSR